MNKKEIDGELLIVCSMIVFFVCIAILLFAATFSMSHLIFKDITGKCINLTTATTTNEKTYEKPTHTNN